MEAKELRIGNLINISGWDVEHHVSEITSIMPSECWVEVIGDGEPEFSMSHLKDVEDVFPIPLTEEWLLKFGFLSQPIEYVSRICNRQLFEIETSLRHLQPIEIYRLTGVENCFYLKVNHGTINPDLKYVHQLQNLHFALTGEELTIK